MRVVLRREKNKELQMKLSPLRRDKGSVPTRPDPAVSSRRVHRKNFTSSMVRSPVTSRRRLDISLGKWNILTGKTEGIHEYGMKSKATGQIQAAGKFGKM
jgi:hypothetical protein